MDLRPVLNADNGAHSLRGLINDKMTLKWQLHGRKQQIEVIHTEYNVKAVVLGEL